MTDNILLDTASQMHAERVKRVAWADHFHRGPDDKTKSNAETLLRFEQTSVPPSRKRNRNSFNGTN